MLYMYSSVSLMLSLKITKTNYVSYLNIQELFRNIINFEIKLNACIKLPNFSITGQTA